MDAPPLTQQAKPALVALRDRREEVIQILSDGYANDLLDDHAFEERVARAHGATRIATLDGLVADLTLPTRPLTTALVWSPPPEDALEPLPRRHVTRAVFSSIERRGAWDVPRELHARAVFGSALLDLREARLAPGVSEIFVKAVFGNIEILVPPQLAVQCDGSAIFASFEHKAGGAAVLDPERPLLKISGRAVFGSIEIKVRPPQARPLADQRQLTT